MSVIIRLQNLPWSANSYDIRQYFSGLSIPEGGVHIIGGEAGDAFIAFSTDEDARRAMMLNGGKLKEIQISLMLSSRTEMYKVVESARSMSYPPAQQTQPQNVAPSTQQQTPIMTSQGQQNLQPIIPPQRQQNMPSMMPAIGQQNIPLPQQTIDLSDNDAPEIDDRNKKKWGGRSRSRSRSRDRSRGVRRDGRRRHSRSRSRERRYRRSRSRSRGRDGRDRYGRDIEKREDFKREKGKTKDNIPDLPAVPRDKHRGPAKNDTPEGGMNDLRQIRMQGGDMNAPQVGLGMTQGMTQPVGMGMPLGSGLAMPQVGMGLPNAAMMGMPMAGGMGMSPMGQMGPHGNLGIGMMQAMPQLMPAGLMAMGGLGNGAQDNGPPNDTFSQQSPFGSRDDALAAAIRSTLPAFTANMTQPEDNTKSFGMGGGRDHERSPPRVDDFRGGPPMAKSRRSGNSRFSDNADIVPNRLNQQGDGPQNNFMDNMRNQNQTGGSEFLMFGNESQRFGGQPTGDGSNFMPMGMGNSLNNRPMDGDERMRNFRRDQGEFEHSNDSFNEPFRSRFSSNDNRNTPNQERSGYNGDDRSQRRSNDNFDQNSRNSRFDRGYDPEQKQRNFGSDSGRFGRDTGRPSRDQDNSVRQNDHSTRDRRDERRERDEHRPVYERAPKNDRDSRSSNERGSRSLENNPRDATCGLCVELKGCPSVGYKEIRRAFNNFSCLISEIKFNNDNPERRVGVQFISWSSKITALKMSNKIQVVGQNVTICHLPEDEFENFCENKRGRRQHVSDNDEPTLPREKETFAKIIGLPTSFTANDISTLLDNRQIAAVQFKETPDRGKIAYLKFPSEIDYEKAVSSSHGGIYKMDKISANEFSSVNQVVEKPITDIPKSEPNKIPPLIQPVVSPCVLLNKLPFGTTDRDICDFFSDIGLVPLAIHLMLNSDGRPSGEAYVEFDTPEMATHACSKNGAPLGRNNLMVAVVPQEQMIEALEGPEDFGSRPNRDPQNTMPQMLPNGQPPPECVVTMENVPFRADTNEILDFFDGRFNIGPQNVFRRLNERGQSTGFARVIMPRPEDALAAVNSFNRKSIRGRPVQLKLLSDVL